MLTRKSKYGLKALLVLAEEADHGPVLIAKLAERQRLPKRFLEATLLELKRAGLLHSKKGKGAAMSSGESRPKSPSGTSGSFRARVPHGRFSSEHV